MVARLTTGLANFRHFLRCLPKPHRVFSTKPVDVKGILKSALTKHKEIELVPLRILDCSLGSSFSSTRLKYEEFVHPEDESAYFDEFSKVFEKGYTLLQQFIDGKIDIYSPNTYDHEDHFYALNALMTFVYEMEYHESCLKDKSNGLRNAFDTKQEGEVAALLTNHLLSRLVYGHKYIISEDYNSQPTQCPCLNSCLDPIQYGQTGIGYEELWYGHPDIILIPPRQCDYLALWFSEDKDNVVQDTYEDRSVNLRNNDRVANMREIDLEKMHFDFDMCAEQILSQAITFAFFQSNTIYKNDIYPASTVIPSLALTPSHYYVIMYDYMNDILLSSGHKKSSLWDKSEMGFNMSAVLQIWMVLNYPDFLPSLGQDAEKFFSGSCNFHTILDNLHLFDKTKKITHKTTFQRGEVVHHTNRKIFRKL